MSDLQGWARPGGPADGPGQGAGPAGPAPGAPPSVPPSVPPSAPAAPGGWGAPPGWSGPPAPPRPGIVPLRPLGLGELYDGAFRAVRSDPRTMLGLSAVVVLVLTLLQALVQVLVFDSLLGAVADPAADPEQVLADLASGAPALVGATLLSSVVTLVATAALTGALTVAVSTAVLGRRTPLDRLWRRVRRRLLTLVLASIVTSLVVGAAALLCLAPGAALLAVALATTDGGTAGLGVVALLLGLLVALAVVVPLAVRLSLTTPAVVLEEQGVGSGLRRSWRLTGRGFWRVLGIQVLGYVIVIVVVQVIGVPFSILGTVAAAATEPGSTAFVLANVIPVSIGGAVAQLVALPLLASLVALQYIDQRMRLEGLDVELARAAAAPA